MEFNEKLQQLRKQNNLTQEQIAEKLFVSRTAISKWESGKGYPNIESLKSISKLFSVTIDELLSGEELINLAEKENSSNVRKIFALIYALLDVMAISFIFLPLYGELEGNHIYAVNLLSYTSQLNPAIYWVVFLVIILIGIGQLISGRIGKVVLEKYLAKSSYAIQVLAVCLFAAAREPYVTTLMFLFLMMKTGVFIKGSKLTE